MRCFLLCLLPVFICFASVFGQSNATLGKKAIIGKITVEGNTVTQTRIILRELSIKAGDEVTTDSLNSLIIQNRLRLFNLQLFNEVNQDVQNVASDTVYWNIHVRERWYIIPAGILQFADRNINTWWTDQGHDLKRVSAGLTLTDRNFRGNLEALAITLQAGYTQKLGLSYMLPYLNRKQTNGIGIIGSVARSRQTYYTTLMNKLHFAGDYSGPVLSTQSEIGLCYIHRPAYAGRHILQVGYKRFSVGDTIRGLNPDYFADSSNKARFAELFYRFEYNGVDNWNYSLRGEKLVTGLVVRTGFEGLKFQSFVNVEAGVFRNPISRWYVSAIARARLMYPGKQPYFFRNGLGSQTDYVRGYEYYVTDGYNYGLMRFDLKREIFNNTYSLPVRYFTAVPVRVYPKVFFDFGYIVNNYPNSNSLVNTLMYSYGFGFDVVSLYDVKIRVEFARNHLGQNGVYLHFNSE